MAIDALAIDLEHELPVARAAALEVAADQHGWLVRSLWSNLAVGFIAGHPKAGKSWLALDLAVSVASGTPCLGRFVVEHPGPALVYLAEDALPRVRERIAALCTCRDLDLDALDLFVITAPSLRLDSPTDQARLIATVARLRPSLLILDPLVRLHRLDENDAGHISALLGFLRSLNREYALAVVLVHHLGKKQRRDLGQSLRGSGDLHAWADSSVFLVRRADQLMMTLEHRSAPAPEPIPLALVTDPMPHLACIGEAPPAPEPSDLSQRALELIAAADQPLSRAVLRQRLRVNNARLGGVLTDLEQRALVLRTAAGWSRSRQGHECMPAMPDQADLLAR